MKKKKTPKQQMHQDIFDYLSFWALKDRKVPKKVLEALDVVLDYMGDIASGRKS